MKFGQLIEHPKKKIFFFKNYTENETGKLVPDRLAKIKWYAA